ncbi:MAG: class I SAM-dependent methyltransferase [Planctomycetes bacterium]|nr:class I SAM-dependent methyltransferase [Planctomycetota bacterium]
MSDAAAITLKTYGRLAEQKLAIPLQPLDPQAGKARVESFLLRTGRPLPRVVVMGAEVALRCRQVDECGGTATGVDGSAAVIELARKLYPQGEFLVGDARSLPVATNSFDGAWTESVFMHVPRAEVARAMSSMHRALRPGGLLYVRLALGEREGFEHSAQGEIFRARWDATEFEQVLNSLDFTLQHSETLPDNEAGMFFRREY